MQNNEMQNHSGKIPFLVKDCAIVSIATGLRARSLSEFRDRLATVESSSLYHHFWGARLAHHFEHPDYHNDFAHWAHFGLHEIALAEKLGIVDPTSFENIEELRNELIEIVERTLEEKTIDQYVSPENQFFFVKEKVIVFDTPIEFRKPIDLLKHLPILSLNSIFYHFIEATNRTKNQLDDFSAWLKGWGDEHEDLINRFRRIDPYFMNLTQLRKKLMHEASEHFVLDEEGKLLSEELP